MGREPRQLHDSGGEERLGTLGIAAAVMMKSGGDLDQALEERFLWLGFDQPYFLPDLVRLEKFARVEMFEAALKFVIFYRSFHRERLRFRIEFIISVGRAAR